ncbi:PREDICTED: putative leucine-rich repeat receptor-like protein kinase At2g19210 [Nicotiana attenuata]|uniref:Leucine-rich repeat receptor-like protein kinase n=1 Tax=Nicotiana attenuata TaxID=49451 RepID=A0A314KH50_NICAT|nr:PREDICTED: putative leucine-rich repeat receptor-like protein kinase At2g19210 [Nicotiana attenuata]OIT28598.1 putative leucine-rich repeat receptor-like protein kinase [Nicotiana attenuata]
MEILKSFLFALLVGFSIATIAVAQKDQSGFISVDCGLPAGSDYTDIRTGISYISDEGHVSDGVSHTISPIYQSNSLEKPFFTVTSFPSGTKNCYTLAPAEGSLGKYLIRASFFYGDYDGSGQLPSFDIYLGEDYWDTIIISNASIPYWTEVIHTPSTDSITVCLVKRDTTTPFISALELRPLKITLYPTLSRSLKLVVRENYGSLTNQLIRYKDDAYDRIWVPSENSGTLSTTQDVVENSYKVPSAVMSTAMTPLYFQLTPGNISDKYYIYMHFAEVEELLGTQTREFNIYINDNLFYGPLSPAYLSTTTVYTLTPGSGYERYDIVINSTVTSTLPPLINALEIYREI